MADAQPPLTWEGSASSNPIVSDTLPDEVITCLQNSRFLHLATALNNRPHVSLMNYTYLPTHPFTSHTTQLPLAGPLIIMTSNPSSKKTLNLLQNHNVSLLVHDWVSSRPPHLSGERERSPTGGARASSLANMLMQMNSAAVSSISATMNGEAMVLEAGTEEERWCREQHLLNNTFEAGGGGGGETGAASAVQGSTLHLLFLLFKSRIIDEHYALPLSIAKNPSFAIIFIAIIFIFRPHHLTSHRKGASPPQKILTVPPFPISASAGE
ncbi:hypothetical protein KC330_g2919 [Hortaea werneckii]|nr:hypothetical protein KC330_g2919 [Hortaea werneckii]